MNVDQVYKIADIRTSLDKKGKIAFRMPCKGTYRVKVVSYALGLNTLSFSLKSTNKQKIQLISDARHISVANTFSPINMYVSAGVSPAIMQNIKAATRSVKNMGIWTLEKGDMIRGAYELDTATQAIVQILLERIC